jgi:hypothetical protein
MSAMPPTIHQMKRARGAVGGAVLRLFLTIIFAILKLL